MRAQKRIIDPPWLQDYAAGYRKTSEQIVAAVLADTASDAGDRSKWVVGITHDLVKTLLTERDTIATSLDDWSWFDAVTEADAIVAVQTLIHEFGFSKGIQSLTIDSKCVYAIKRRSLR